MIESRIRLWLAWAIGGAVALVAAWTARAPFRTNRSWLYFQQDDFYYYLKIAENLAAGHGSTFNGLVATNGYHPLWLLLLTGVARSGAGPHGLMVFLAIVAWLATVSTFAFSCLLLLRSGVDELTSAACAAFLAAYASHLFFEGMEITLATPLMGALMLAFQAVRWWSSGGVRGWVRSFGIGLLASATILSRLDTALFVALLVGWLMIGGRAQRRIRMPQVTGFAAGTLPVLFYLISNRIFFGIWMPVSGMAKQLKLDHGFTSKAVRSLLSLSPTSSLSLLVVAVALLMLPWFYSRLRMEDRSFVPAALMFLFLYIGTLSWLSDWRLWGWYLYGMEAALCAVALMLLSVPWVRRVARSPVVAFVLALVAMLELRRMEWPEQSTPLVDAAFDVQRFASTHAGVYAMGDRSGVVGYLLHEPLVQTEGLVMDRAFLTKIARQMPLREALAPYHVRYYVGTAVHPFTGCFQAVEPFQGGPHTPHLQDQFCQTPLARWTHDDIETLIFDVDAP